MKKLRIAFFAEILIRDFDGATRTIFQIIDRIDRSKFEFLFFCGVPPNEPFDHRVIKIPTFAIPFNSTYEIASMIGQGSMITRELDQFDPDVIHISTPSPLGYFGMKYATARNIPVCTIYHTHFLSYIKYYTKQLPILTPVLEEAVAIHNRSFYNRCDKVFIPTEEIKSQLQEKGFRVAHFKIWKRGINLELFSPKKRNKNHVKTITGNSNQNILFVSRLVWEKNLKTLIKIAKLMQEELPAWNLIIAGDGIARPQLEKEMPWAKFLGHVDHEQLSVLYASCDYFLFTSSTETYGNVVAEAMASGIPCIAADGGGVKNIISHGINGMLCSPESPMEYIRAIKVMENHPDYKDSLVKKALDEIQVLNWDKIVADYFTDIIELAKKSEKFIPPDSFNQDMFSSVFL